MILWSWTSSLVLAMAAGLYDFWRTRKQQESAESVRRYLNDRGDPIVFAHRVRISREQLQAPTAAAQ